MSPVLQARDVLGESAGFLNRWSRVRIAPRTQQRDRSGFGDPRFDDRDTSLALLRAVAEGHGEDAHALAIELALRVIERSEVALALTVLEGGPLVVGRAIDLATCVLDSDGARRLAADG